MYKAFKQWLVYACILYDDEGDGDDYGVFFNEGNLAVYKE